VSAQISPDIAKLFNFLHDKDYTYEDNPDINTLSFEILKTLMEDYYFSKVNETYLAY
jgi:hypothetical protein